MSERILAIKNSEGLCYKCLNTYLKSNINTISLGDGMGYGSGFDNFSTKLQLCNNCYCETDSKWWNKNIVYSGDTYCLERMNKEKCKNKDCKTCKNVHWTCEAYEHENEIFDYINSLPLQGQELVYNTNSHGACADFMDAQDWIDSKLSILPHERCKEYGLYSPQEIQAYHDRFPTCGEVYLQIYDDESSACYCNCGASGNSDGTCDSNISDECYQCTHYKPKSGSMKVIYEMDEFIERETIRLKDMLDYATKNLALLENDSKGYRARFE